MLVKDGLPSVDACHVKPRCIHPAQYCMQCRMDLSTQHSPLACLPHPPRPTQLPLTPAPDPEVIPKSLLQTPLTQHPPPPQCTTSYHPSPCTAQLERDGEDDDVYRRAVEKYPPTTALTSVPCGRCPVIDQCRDGGLISPQTCEYYQKWLDF